MIWLPATAMTMVIALLISTSVSTSPASALESDSALDIVNYRVEAAEVGSDLTIQDVFNLSEAQGAVLTSIGFAGAEGAGRIAVYPADNSSTVLENAVQLFIASSTAVPRISDFTVSVGSERPAPAFNLGGNALNVISFPGSSALTQGVQAGPSLQDTAANLGEMSAPRKQAKVTIPNDWPAYFPWDWRNEARNVLRCTQYASGKCWSTAPRATLTQSVRWAGSAGTPVPWPFADWGFEFGVTLTNSAMCSPATSYQGWWLGSNYAEWSTNVPSSAGPYFEGNRLFDDCANMSHQVGIRDPQLLIQGYQYSFTVSAPRNTAQLSTRFIAYYQAVHDDCTVGLSLTDCMGLNTAIAWPYATIQSAPVVNASRNFTVPGCARMYRGWTAPVRWNNGASYNLSAPLSFSDTCLSNDY